MNIYSFLILFILWYGLSLWISEKYGRHRKIGEEWSFFTCFMLSPVLGLIITLLTNKTSISRSHQPSAN